MLRRRVARRRSKAVQSVIARNIPLIVGAPQLEDPHSPSRQTLNGGDWVTNAAAGPSVKKFGVWLPGIRALIAAWNFA